MGLVLRIVVMTQVKYNSADLAQLVEQPPCKR